LSILSDPFSTRRDREDHSQALWYDTAAFAARTADVGYARGRRTTRMALQLYHHEPQSIAQDLKESFDRPP
jgi:hypothetical protein